MFKNIADQINPQTVRAIKVAAIAVGVVAGAVVTGIVLYKMGVIGQSVDIVEEVVETAVQTAS